MARHTLTSGFLLAETAAAVFIISFMAVLLGNMCFYETDAAHVFEADYYLCQSASMASASGYSMESRAPESFSSIRFSDKGNVNMAKTLVLGRSRQETVVELGFGRLVFR